MIKATRYFREQVINKRPELDVEMCRNVLASPLKREVQADGRIRHWGEATRDGETFSRFLRVVTLDDGETIHNAFFDRGFQRGRP